MTSIKLQKISKQFGETQVIRELDLSVVEGEFLTLVGPSGCGKSTLLRIIAGLEQQTGGHISIANRSIEGKRPSERDLAMVFQSYALYPHLTVFENIAVPLRMRLLSNWQRVPLVRRFIFGTRQLDESILAQVLEVAETLGITELLNRKPGELSGGQRQRVAVGRAIIRQPKAFLFDEPLSNLDAKLRVHMRAEITRLHQQLKTTFVYVTHDQVEAMTMSDRIAVMMQGEIIQIGTPAEVYHNPKDIRVAQFIGSPEINILTANVQESGRILLLGQLMTIPLNGFEPSKDLQDSPVHIGIRPENLFVCHDKTEASRQLLRIQVKVVLLENLGAEVFVHLVVVDSHTALDSPAQDQAIPNTLLMRLTYDVSIGITLGQMLTVGFFIETSFVFDEQGKRIDQYSSQQGQLSEVVLGDSNV